MCSSLSLPLNPTLSHKPYFLYPQHHSCFSLLLKRPSHSLRFSSLVSHCSNNPSNEEQRWLREEQRWLREEQRWLREEQRWARERDSLLRQIAELNLHIQTLERRLLAQHVSSSSSVSDVIANVTALLQVLKEKNNGLIAESGVSSAPMVLEEKRQVAKEIEKEVVIEETGRVSNEKKAEKRKPLRKGSEGDDVREMQVCLQYEFLPLWN